MLQDVVPIEKDVSDVVAPQRMTLGISPTITSGPGLLPGWLLRAFELIEIRYSQIAQVQATATKLSNMMNREITMISPRS